MLVIVLGIIVYEIMKQNKNPTTKPTSTPTGAPKNKCPTPCQENQQCLYLNNKFQCSSKKLPGQKCNVNQDCINGVCDNGNCKNNSVNVISCGKNRFLLKYNLYKPITDLGKYHYARCHDVYGSLTSSNGDIQDDNQNQYQIITAKCKNSEDCDIDIDLNNTNCELSKNCQNGSSENGYCIIDNNCINNLKCFGFQCKKLNTPGDIGGNNYNCLDSTMCFAGYSCSDNNVCKNTYGVCNTIKDCGKTTFCNDNNICQSYSGIGQRCSSGIQCQPSMLCKNNVCGITKQNKDPLVNGRLLKPEAKFYIVKNNIKYYIDPNNISSWTSSPKKTYTANSNQQTNKEIYLLNAETNKYVHITKQEGNKVSIQDTNESYKNFALIIDPYNLTLQIKIPDCPSGNTCPKELDGKYLDIDNSNNIIAVDTPFHFIRFDEMLF